LLASAATLGLLSEARQSERAMPLDDTGQTSRGSKTIRRGAFCGRPLEEPSPRLCAAPGARNEGELRIFTRWHPGDRLGPAEQRLQAAYSPPAILVFSVQIHECIAEKEDVKPCP
jgi:hypothetical protein